MDKQIVVRGAVVCYPAMTGEGTGFLLRTGEGMIRVLRKSSAWQRLDMVFLRPGQRVEVTGTVQSPEATGPEIFYQVLPEDVALQTVRTPKNSTDGTETEEIQEMPSTTTADTRQETNLPSIQTEETPEPTPPPEPEPEPETQPAPNPDPQDETGEELPDFTDMDFVCADEWINGSTQPALQQTKPNTGDATLDTWLPFFLLACRKRDAGLRTTP